MQPFFKDKHNPRLLRYAKKLSNYGKLSIKAGVFVYLDVSDDFIYKLFPLVQEENIVMPDYFSSEKNIGAHISVIYPEEQPPNLSLAKCNELIEFSIQSFCTTTVFEKDYFMLKIRCEKLSNLRNQLGLDKVPVYKSTIIPFFHITIAIRNRD